MLSSSRIVNLVVAVIMVLGGITQFFPIELYVPYFPVHPMIPIGRPLRTTPASLSPGIVALLPTWHSPGQECFRGFRVPTYDANLCDVFIILRMVDGREN